METWWKEAVIYQIYPRSFYDSNGDGTGDLQGIIDKLDYIQELGAEAIWLSPIYPSPMFDFGYDISDYESIDPIFGNLDIFKNLLKEAHSRKIRIIMDLVINHTSHKHPWFIESKSSRTNPKRDWYIWKDPVDGKEPNQWMASFGGKGWEFDQNTGQYYYHAFLPEQPDLNWRNPEVKKTVFSMIEKWLELGVDGFRLDVVNYYVKDSELRNNPKNYLKGLRPYDWQYHIYDRNRPETMDIVREFRALLDRYGDRMSVGEVYQEPPGGAELPASYYGEKNDGLHMAFNFAFLYSRWKSKSFLNNILAWEKTIKPGDWPNYTLSNHDQPRHFSRYSCGKKSIPRAKLAAVLLLTLRGTPFLYYGEEIGMTSERVPKNKIQDPVGLKYWPIHPGRDGSRRPMCWNTSGNSGFTQGEPWLPVSKRFKEFNVEVQKKDPDSIYHVYKKMIEVRRKEFALRLGAFENLSGENKDVLAFIRSYQDRRILVALNFKNRMSFLDTSGLNAGKEVLFSTEKNREMPDIPGNISLYPNEGLVIALA